MRSIYRVSRVYNFLAPFASDIVNCYWNGVSWS